MHCDYYDITDRLGEPIWWDEHAVPRYCEFSPGETAYIYSNVAALVLIECQGCGHEFKVAFTESVTCLPENRISKLIQEGRLHYGDPPNWDCCDAGASMNSIPIRVLEYWKNRLRDPEFEVDLKLPWRVEDNEN